MAGGDERPVYEGAYEGDLAEPEDEGAEGPEGRAGRAAGGRASGPTAREVPGVTVGEYGLPPVPAQEAARGTVHHRLGSGGRPPRMSRRRFVATACGMAAGALAAGAGAAAWYAHRQVLCRVDGVQRLAPVGSTAGDLVARGLASPSSGNLVAISAAGEAPEVLRRGGGEPYSIVVNGQPADASSWRLAEGDEVEFRDGADVVEQAVADNTEIPCGAKVPLDGYLLAKAGYVASWGRTGLSTVETGSVSGKVVDRGVTREPEDFVIACARHVDPADGRRLAALTFDDGPDLAYTPQFLDILSAYGAKATFFNIGSQVEASAEHAALSRRCAQEGHQVASHSYAHRDLLSLEGGERAQDLSRAFELVGGATGVPTNVMRAPYGNFYGSTFLDYLRRGGDVAYAAYWGVDSKDWEAAEGLSLEEGAEAIVANCTVAGRASLADDPEEFNGSIILMHDGGGDRSRGVLALPRVIEAYLAQGFQLVTLNELLASTGALPAWVTSGLAVRPADACVPVDDSSVEWYDPTSVDPLA